MHTGLEEAPDGFARMAAFYAARARGGVGLIVTGGIAPNLVGRLEPKASQLSWSWQLARHRLITDAVHAEGGKIALQILHAGRYAYHPFSVAPSASKSAITPFRARALSGWGVRRTIAAYVRCAALAQRAGYDGVEVMGSEGYLINQFIAPRTNHRDDEWGGSYANRMRFPLEIVRQTRAAVGREFIIIYRLSMLDLVEGGSTWDEVVELAQAVEAAGATLINTGVGWHEARIPTIATMVPRGAYTWVTRRLKGLVKIPLITTNRINDPAVADAIIAGGDADVVSMARPFLADADFVNKASANRADAINTCIACNQACLDHIFNRQIASCLVNPFACRETELEVTPAAVVRKIAVVGAGPAGLACSTTAAQRGHAVTLFDAAAEIGGQFNLARRIPGKEEFAETLRYFRTMLVANNVAVELGRKADAHALSAFDEVDSRHRHRCAHAGHSRHRSPKRCKLCRHRVRPQSCRAARRHYRRRRHRLRRRRAIEPRGRRQPRRLSGRVGHRRRLCESWRHHATARHRLATRVVAPATQTGQGRRRLGQDHRLDPAHAP